VPASLPPPLTTSPARPHLPVCLQYSISEYRDRLYLEIVKRKKELRRAAKDREAAKAAASRSKSRSSGYHGSSAAPAAGAYGSSAAYGHAAVRH
jgi:mitogen-activated protein kinase 15